MTTKNITITYPDAAATRILAALKKHYGQIEASPGVFRDRTDAEAFAEFEKSCRRSLKHLVRKVEDDARTAAAAAAGEPDVDIT